MKDDTLPPMLARTEQQFGNALRRARKRLGLSQGDLGEKAGLRQSTISDIERGNAGAKLDTILQLLAALDLELEIKPRRKAAPADIEDIF